MCDTSFADRLTCFFPMESAFSLNLFNNIELCLCGILQHNARQTVPGGMCNIWNKDSVPNGQQIRDTAEAETCSGEYI